VTEAQAAYQQLRQRILTGEYRPGAVLLEEEMTSSLGVGRTPLRDALQRLSHDGLVEIRPRQGTYVSQVTLDDLGEIFEARAVIERAISAVAIERSRGPLLDGLGDLIARAKRVDAAQSDVAIDAAFHELFLTAVHNRYLAETYRRLLDASVRLFYLTGCGMESPAEQHRTLVQVREAVESGDSGSLERALLEHLGAFRDRVSGSLFSGHARR
jgi:DNA-binding GntR family transcriptional regulator